MTNNEVNTQRPKVSVLMAVYNGERFLRTAIESILSQTFGDFEFIIVDDASTDASRDIIASYNDPRINVVTNARNLGLTKSLNIGLGLAKGELIARQDADDISYVTRLATQVSFLDRNPHVALVGAQARTVDEDGGSLKHNFVPSKATTTLGIKWQILIDGVCIHTSVMFRKQVIWGMLRGYDESFTNGQDAELWFRVLESHGLANLPETLVDFRVHSKSMSTQTGRVHPESIKRGEADLLRKIRKYFTPVEIPDRWAEWYVGVYVNRDVSNISEARGLTGGLETIWRAFLRERPGLLEKKEFSQVIALKLLLVARYLWRAYPRIAALSAISSWKVNRNVVAEVGFEYLKKIIYRRM